MDILNSTSKSVKEVREFYFRVATRFGKGFEFIVGKGNVSKDIYKGLISVTPSLALLGKNLFSVVSKNCF